MLKIRSIVAIILVAVTTLLVSCGSPKASAPPTYTPEKIAQIQRYVPSIETAREDMTRLKGFIDEKNWIDTRTFIHGPLGQLRQDMNYLTRQLLPKDQKQASELAKEVFTDLEELDTEAKLGNYSFAVQRYNKTVKDIDAFLQLVPKSESTT